MIDVDALSAALQAASDATYARALGREVTTLRGLRGVPNAEIARIASETWKASPVDLDTDEAALGALFSTSFDDGLLAIALLATRVSDQPAEVLEIGLDWLTRVDDHQTADALGWVVLGPAAMRASGSVLGLHEHIDKESHPCARRAIMMTGMALLPVPVESVAAAGLRARFDTGSLALTDRVHGDELAALCTLFYRDDAPAVRKALRRVLGAWGRLEPDACEEWADTQRGGIARMLREEVTEVVKRARRKLKRVEGAEPG